MRYTLVFIIASCLSAAQGLSTRDLRSVDRAISSIVRRNAATLVRLAFHDCVGGCNGCLNVNNPDNAGLEDVVEALETAYVDNSISSLMSRADFWAYAGQAALMASVAVTDGVEETDLNISFQTGRVDCDSAPYTDDDVELPGPNMNYEELISFYAERFGMDEEQAVAIMGAHTLGGADTENSGYNGAWIAGARANREFNNQYYTIMLDGDWAQRNQGDNKWQWNARGVGFMLNSDMCLVKEMELNEDGVSGCTYDSCASSAGISYVQKFSDSQSDWLAKFSEAWTIMQSAGDYTLTDLQ